jgi:uncharacterized membrane protein
LPETAPGKPRRWRDWLLIASLGVNLAILGLAAGAILRGPSERMAAGPGLWHYARALPDPYRRDLGQELRTSRRDWAPSRDALRGQREALAQALTADPYDPARVAGIIGEELRLAADLGDRGAGLLLGQIERMSPSDRAAFADRLRQERPVRERSGRRSRD